MAEPSSTIEFSTVVSRPPSVAVRPVRGMTLTRPWLANLSTSATCCVPRAITTAAGTGRVNTPCTSS